MTTDAPGTLNINGGSVTTSGGQSYHDATVTLGANTVLNHTGAASLVIDGTTLALGAFTLTDNPTTAGSTGTISNAIAGNSAAALIKNGLGTLTLSGAMANTFTGTTTVNNGSLVLGKSANIVAVSGDLFVGTGVFGDTNTATATLAANGQTATTSNVTVNFNGTLATATFNDQIVNLNLQGSGPNGANNPSTGALVSGTGTLSLTGNSTYTVLAATTGSVGALVQANLVLIGGATHTFNVAAGTPTNGADYVLTGALNGPDSFSKTNSGILRYSGTTTTTLATSSVVGGTLLLDGTLNVAGPGLVVSTAGTLGGTGTLNAILSANSGGTVSPADPTTPATGILTVNGKVTFNAGSTYFVNLNPGTPGNEPVAGSNYDQLKVTGSGNTIAVDGAALAGTSGAIPIGSEFTIILNAVNGAGSGGLVTGNPNPNFSGIFEGGFITVGGVTYNITYAGNNHNDVVLSLPGRFDFGTATSPVDTIDGYTGVNNGTIKTTPGVGPAFGWTSAPLALDRGTPNALLRDLNYSSNVDDFLTDVVQAGTYRVTVVMGDAAVLHDNIQVAFPGARAWSPPTRRCSPAPPVSSSRPPTT